MNSEKLEKSLKQHVPPETVAYCLDLWRQFEFEFRVRKSRVTKVGDFTYHANKPARITVNKDLHPYLFLITYVHEVAHVAVHCQYGNRVAGHGPEWKRAFQQAMAPLLSETIFPDELLLAIRKHMTDPPATTFSDSKLMQVFRKYDAHAKMQTILSDIPEGALFGIRGRYFRKGKTNRTRVVCQEVKTKRKYLVPVDSPVENVQLSLL